MQCTIKFPFLGNILLLLELIIAIPPHPFAQFIKYLPQVHPKQIQPWISYQYVQTCQGILKFWLFFLKDIPLLESSVLKVQSELTVLQACCTAIALELSSLLCQIPCLLTFLCFFIYSLFPWYIYFKSFLRKGVREVKILRPGNAFIPPLILYTLYLIVWLGIENKVRNNFPHRIFKALFYCLLIFSVADQKTDAILIS